MLRRAVWVALVMTACAEPGPAAGTTRSGTTTTESTTTEGSSTATGSDAATDGFVACESVACVAGAVGCSCRGQVCDDAEATCEGGRCIVIVDDMVQVPEGPFCMGCNAEADDGCVSDELPAHEVWVSTFEIDRTEVTQAAFAECIEAGVCSVPDADASCGSAWDPVAFADRPVACIGWDTARGYCTWRNKRLPTEAEWEKAARGIEGLTFAWGAEPPICALANFGDAGEECVGEATPVGTYPDGMSPYGAFDMGGNVWERVQDWYAADYYATGPTTDPQGPDSGSSRVLRGGSFTSFAKFLRTAARDGARAPWVTARNLGFRCARTP